MTRRVLATGISTATIRFAEWVRSLLGIYRFHQRRVKPRAGSPGGAAVCDLLWELNATVARRRALPVIQ